ncbi:MAG TPA: glycosyltransferase [Miltoncostaeaceae bacterium]|nr:glycosyltransferase [Miltoncostaeaceae bacterium]
MGLQIIPDESAPRVSLCMIMRDEEEHLERCLRSVRGAVDEIVIVDTGSVDGSVQIAERFGARVLHEPWRGDFAAPRNTALDAATGDWALVLDADEELVDADGLRALVAQEGVEGWSLREVNFIGEERGIDSVVMSAFRLFRRRPEYRYAGALHEQIMATVQIAGHGELRFSDLQINHYGYLEPTTRAKRKSDRNMAIVLEQVRQAPRDSYVLFNAGVEFQRVGRYQDALDHFLRAFESLNSLDQYYASILVRNIALTLYALERYDDALAILADGLQAYPDFPDLHYAEGRVFAARREYRAAIRSFTRAIDNGDHDGERYACQAGVGSFHAHHCLGITLEAIGDKPRAVQHLKRAIELADGFFPAPVANLTSLLLQTDPPDVVREYVSRLLPARRRGEALCLVADALLQDRHPREAAAALADARDAGAAEDAVRVRLARVALFEGDLPRARAESLTVAAGSVSYRPALVVRATAALHSGDDAAAREAVEALVADEADPATTTALRLLVDARAGEATPPTVANAMRAAVVARLLAFAAEQLTLGRTDLFNLTAPLLHEVAGGEVPVDEPLGRLLLAEGFEEPAAERLLAAVRSGEAGPDALADLGAICEERDLPEDAEAFHREALARDDQNPARYLNLARLLVGRGRYADADRVLRDGLIMHPHSTVLSELHESMALLARA